MVLIIDCGRVSKKTQGVGVVFNEASPPPVNHWG